MIRAGCCRRPGCWPGPGRVGAPRLIRVKVSGRAAHDVLYNYSEIYMAGFWFANQYRYMLNAWHPVRNPNSDIPRAGAKSDAALQALTL